MIIDVSGILPENANKDKKIPEGSYITEQGNMTTDTPVQFLKLPETEKSDNQVHNVPLIPIPSPKPKVTEFQTTTQKIVPATEAQKREAYNRMRQLSDEKDANGNYVNRNTTAENFVPYTNIRISDAEARGLAQNHMNNDLAHLRGEFSDFDNFPLPLKEILLDIQYNVKGGVNRHNWPNLYRAIRNRDVNGIVENVNRRDVAQRRNNWTRDTARSIRF